MPILIHSYPGTLAQALQTQGEITTTWMVWTSNKSDPLPDRTVCNKRIRSMLTEVDWRPARIDGQR